MTVQTLALGPYNLTSGQGLQMGNPGRTSYFATRFPHADDSITVQLYSIDEQTIGNHIDLTTGEMKYGDPTRGGGYVMFNSPTDISNLPSWATPTLPTGRFNSTSRVDENKCLVSPTQVFPVIGAPLRIYGCMTNTNQTTNVGDPWVITEPCIISFYLSVYDTGQSATAFTLQVGPTGTNFASANTQVRFTDLRGTGIGVWVSYYVNVAPGGSVSIYAGSGTSLTCHGVFFDPVPFATNSATAPTVMTFLPGAVPKEISSYISPSGVANASFWKLDRGPSDTTTTFLEARIRGIIPPPTNEGGALPYTSSTVTLNRQTDQVGLAIGDGTTDTRVLTPSYLTTPMMIPGNRWTSLKIPTLSQAISRTCSVIVDNNTSRGSGKDLPSGIQSIMFVGSTSTINANDKPICPKISPCNASAKTGTIPVTLSLPADNTAMSIFYTVDGKKPVGDNYGNAVGTTQKVAPGSIISISSTCQLRTIAGFFNSQTPNAGSTGKWVYSIESEGRYIISTERVSGFQNYFFDDGTDCNTGNLNGDMGCFPIDIWVIRVFNNTSRDGWFYLYGQPKTSLPGLTSLGYENPEPTPIKCYKTKDFVTFTPLGIVQQDYSATINSGDIRPQVVYYNGQYIMYTRTEGNIIASTCAVPTGPFVRQPTIQANSGDFTIMEDISSGSLVLTLTWNPVNTKFHNYNSLNATGLAIAGTTVTTGTPLSGPGETAGQFNREGIATLVTPAGDSFTVSSAAEYYNSSQENNPLFLHSANVAGYAGQTALSSPLTTFPSWSTVNSYYYTPGYNLGTGTFNGTGIPVGPNAWAYTYDANANPTPERNELSAIPGLNIQPSGSVYLGNQGILSFDWYYYQGTIGTNFLQSCCVLLPVTPSGNNLPFPDYQHGSWDITDFYNPSSTSNLTISVSPNIDSIGNIGIWI